MYSFDNAEIIEILTHPENWSEIDSILAEKISEERGIGLSEEEIETIIENEVARENQNDNFPFVRIIFCYAFILMALFVSALLLFIVFIIAQGYFFWKGKKTLSNGEKIFQYSKSVRIQGLAIFAFGIGVILFSFLSALFFPFFIDM